MPSKEETPIHFNPSTLENIDMSMYEHINEGLNLHTSTGNGFTKVPVIWVGAERSNQIKKDVGLRNKDGLLNLPLIAIERTSVTKDPGKRGPVPGNIPDAALHGMIPAFTIINDGKTTIFKRSANLRKYGANLDFGDVQKDHPQVKQPDYIKQKISHRFDLRPKQYKNLVVYKTYYMPIPVYISLKYEITIQTQYQQQMNDLMAPWITGFNGSGNLQERNHRWFMLKREVHLYEAWIDGSFSSENNISTLQEEERKFVTKISIDVLGYLVGSDKNEDANEFKAVENLVDIKFTRERVLVGDIPDHINRIGTKPFYKE